MAAPFVGSDVLSPQGAQVIQAQKVVRLGDEAPDFKAETQLGLIHFHEYIKDSWAILFSHPANFTPVCTTELGRVAQLKDEWAKRGVKVVGLSVDDVENHKKWIQDINDTQNTEVWFPIVADKERQVAILYGMLDPNFLDKSGMPFTVRSVFFIDPKKKVRLIMTYPAATGRNFDEILRCLDALSLTDKYKVACPVDWKKGKDTVVLASIPDSDAVQLFPKGVNKVRPYLRMTPDPSV
jgi:alkyl hydroperoxide reductase subunit AhpC